MEHTAGIVPTDRIRHEVSRPPRALVERYEALPDAAGLVARTLDQFGVMGTVPASDLTPLKPGAVVVGPALTVRNIPSREIPYRRWKQGNESQLGERDAFFIAQPGDVIVIDGTAVLPASCLGSMSVALAAKLGVAGVVVAGAATGIKGIRAAAIPVWAVGGTTITGHHRVETIEINGPIGMRGVRVEPGDLVVADDSGVTIVPLSLVESVLQQAEKTSRLSAPLRTAIESGDDREDLRNVLRRWWKDYARLGKDV